MPNLNLGPGGHGRRPSKGCRWWGENVTMCVVTPQGTGPLAPAAGKSGAAGVRGKKAGTWQQRCVCVWRGEPDFPPGVGPCQAPIYQPLESHRLGSPSHPAHSFLHVRGSPSHSVSCLGGKLSADAAHFETFPGTLAKETWRCPHLRGCWEGKEESRIT